MGERWSAARAEVDGRAREKSRHAADDALAQGAKAPSLVGYLANPQFWFESFQNWQSEFLSTAVLILLAIWLREKGSPESKAVADPHAKTGND